MATTVRSLLMERRRGFPHTYTACAIWQRSIPEIDPCPDDVRRYMGDLDTCLESNQNFLDYPVMEVREVKCTASPAYRLIVLCEPTEQQKEAVIYANRAYRYSL